VGQAMGQPCSDGGTGCCRCSPSTRRQGPLPVNRYVRNQALPRLPVARVGPSAAWIRHPQALVACLANALRFACQRRETRGVVLHGR